MCECMCVCVVVRVNVSVCVNVYRGPVQQHNTAQMELMAPSKQLQTLIKITPKVIHKHEKQIVATFEKLICRNSPNKILPSCEPEQGNKLHTA